MSTEKKCSNCGVLKNASDFHANKRRKDGLSGKCKPCTQAYNTKRYDRDRDNILSKGREYNLRTVENRKARYNAKMAENPSVFRCYNASRYSRKRGLVVSNVDFFEIAEGLGWHCFYCDVLIDKKDTKSWHVEHKTPLSRGGSHTKDNITLSCASCNMRKGARTVEEFRSGVARGRNA